MHLTPDFRFVDLDAVVTVAVGRARVGAFVVLVVALEVVLVDEAHVDLGACAGHIRRGRSLQNSC